MCVSSVTKYNSNCSNRAHEDLRMIVFNSQDQASIFFRLVFFSQRLYCLVCFGISGNPSEPRSMKNTEKISYGNKFFSVFTCEREKNYPWFDIHVKRKPPPFTIPDTIPYAIETPRNLYLSQFYVCSHATQTFRWTVSQKYRGTSLKKMLSILYTRLLLVF